MMISMLCTLLAAGAPIAQPAQTQPNPAPQADPQVDESDEGPEFNDDEEGYSYVDFEETEEPEEDAN